MCALVSFKSFENSLTTVKVMTKTKVAPFYLGHGVFFTCPFHNFHHEVSLTTKLKYAN